MIKATVSTILVFLISVSSVFGQSDDPADLLAKSESLTTQGDFYEALITLQSLFTTDQKSHDQEQAFWIANQLCETLIKDGIIQMEFEEICKKEIRREKDYMQYEKIVTLNELGADIGYNEIAGSYAYNYGFLRRLVEFYPDSKYRPSAEYYFIPKGYNEPENVERWLKDLYSYVNKYSDSVIRELYMAYLDIAHINDTLWRYLTYPDKFNSEHFQSGDLALDKEKAVKYKAEALKCYSKVIISGYVPEYYTRSDIIKRFKELKQNKKTDDNWIFYD